MARASNLGFGLLLLAVLLVAAFGFFGLSQLLQTEARIIP